MRPKLSGPDAIFINKKLTALSGEWSVPRCWSNLGLSPTSTSWLSQACTAPRVANQAQQVRQCSLTKSYGFVIGFMTWTWDKTPFPHKGPGPEQRFQLAGPGIKRKRRLDEPLNKVFHARPWIFSISLRSSMMRWSDLDFAGKLTRSSTSLVHLTDR